MLTIVVIDDDMAMRTLICEWLAAEGYRVRGLAVAAVGANADADLVIVDVLNPRAGWAEALRDVRAAYPQSAVVVTSTQLARSLESDSPLARALGVRRLIAKPFARDELLGAVADAVGARN